MLLAGHLFVMASVAEEYTKKLDPTNMSLVVPFGAANWREGVQRTNKALGGKVGAVTIFSQESDMKAFGPIANTVAKYLGTERAVFVAPVLDAVADTIGDSSLSLPHVLLLLPDGVEKTWAEWVPNMFTPNDRHRVAKTLAEWVGEHLDECADAGTCHDTIDEQKAARVRHKIQEDMRKQSGEAREKAYATKRSVNFDPLSGTVKHGEEKIVPASALDVEAEKKRKERKKKEKKKQKKAAAAAAKDEV